MRSSAADWISGSAFVDENGRPVVFYHGTDIDLPFNVFCQCGEGSIGFHFGSADTADTRLRQIREGEADYDDGMSIIPVICRSTNPLRLNDLLCWGTREVIDALVDADVMTASEAETLLNDDDCDLETIYAYIEEAGYDAVVYCNWTEGGTGDSLIAWRPEMLKSPFSYDFAANDPRLLSQLPTDPRDLDACAAQASAIERERQRIRNYRWVTGFAATP